MGRGRRAQPVRDEAERVAAIYADYDSVQRHRRRWRHDSPGNAYLEAERIQIVDRLLERAGLFPLGDKRILDVGCGSGDELRRLRARGAQPELCHGVDLLPDRIEAAAAADPDMTFVCADAQQLPYEDGSFDLVTAHVVFSSMVDRSVAHAVAREIARVLAPSGVIVWRDFRYPNPWNSNLRGYSRRAIRNLFPDFSVTSFGLAPLPPLARLFGRASRILMPLVGAIPLLRTQNLALLRRRPKAHPDDPA
jgi:ubiquinone/menaquinone biosynthesis C-methylase UbiE